MAGASRLGNELRQGFQDAVHRTPDLEKAVESAAELARPGDVVLLSPGCASFDQFPGYAQRGDAFIGFAAELATHHGTVGR